MGKVLLEKEAEEGIRTGNSYYSTGIGMGRACDCCCCKLKYDSKKLHVIQRGQDEVKLLSFSVYSLHPWLLAFHSSIAGSLVLSLRGISCLIHPNCSRNLLGISCPMVCLVTVPK